MLDVIGGLILAWMLWGMILLRRKMSARYIAFKDRMNPTSRAAYFRRMDAPRELVTKTKTKVKAESQYINQFEDQDRMLDNVNDSYF